MFKGIFSSFVENSLDYDEMSGRLRLADFLYAEYSLEEVIYQLAKVSISILRRANVNAIVVIKNAHSTMNMILSIDNFLT